MREGRMGRAKRQCDQAQTELKPYRAIPKYFSGSGGHKRRRSMLQAHGPRIGAPGGRWHPQDHPPTMPPTTPAC